MALLAIIVLTVFSVHDAQSAAFARNQDVTLRLIQVIKEGNGVEVIYEIRNISKSDIWVYVGNSRTDGQPFETMVTKASNKLYLGFISVDVPEGASLGEAVSFRYKKLLSGRAMMFRLALDAVVVDFNPVSGKGQSRMKAMDIDEIELKVGYYTKALDSEEECCMPAKLAAEMFVKSTWAASNREDTLSVIVSKKHRWK